MRRPLKRLSSPCRSGCGYAARLGGLLLGLAIAASPLAAKPVAAPAPGPQASATPSGNPADGSPSAFAPHSARFAVRYRGIDAGTSEIRLERLPGNGEPRYVFTNRSKPHGLAALFVPGTITQRSVFTLDDGGVRPADYLLEDGGKSTDRDVRLSFDWGRHRVTGIAEEQAIDLPLVAGTQDALTVGLQVRWLLQQDRKPQRLVMVENTRAKEYDYTFEGRERLQTALGAVDTVLWSSRRPGSNRVTRTWYAPAYGYVAVKAEQVSGDKLLMSLAITAWQRLP